MLARSTIGECKPSFGQTAWILHLTAMARRAGAGAPLLIRGEPGVGKDTLARLIHDASVRRFQAFIKVNCAAQPADRLEVDLFGHDRRTSPPATRRRLGSLEFANRGTLYLDEIEAVPNALVPKLLHVLQTGEVSRAGESELIHVDVRLIASTASGGAIRDDLRQALLKLNAIEICIPPLRQRTEEIPVLTSFFLRQLNRRYRRDVHLCSDVMATFQARGWPGNIRELADEVHRLVLGRAPAPVH